MLGLGKVEGSGTAIFLWRQEMPQNLRSPERTPPSEEDLAEAERLKTEGERRVLHPHWHLTHLDSRGCKRVRQAGPWL